ncbi:TetR/AcrR family transcriptional regulator [Glutamicibacter sp.]|uniref:TetR/AcrR family transcriptional regulator n=1 Tax=Glutamicibacter sp. TaxID=1931995 RepID=UPI002FDF2196
MTTPQRPMRADAIRNHAKILDAARTEIATHGPEVGMEIIATSAGVAVGTLYRHFPTKVDLVAAVLAEYAEYVALEAEAALERAQAGASPLTVVVDFLREVIRVSAMNSGAKSAAPAIGVTANIDETRAAAALSEMIRLGIDAGQIREDLRVEDVYTLISAAPLDQPEPVRARWADLFLPCLTADAARIELEEIARR